MRSLIALLPLLAACEAWSEPPKDATWADDSASSADCRAGKSTQDTTQVFVQDLMIDGLAQVPSVDMFCASTDGLGVQIDLSVEDVSASFYLELSDYGGFTATDEQVTTFAFYYDDESWTADQVYSGSVTISASDDSGTVSEGIVLAEATSDNDVNLLLSLIWTQ